MNNNDLNKILDIMISSYFNSKYDSDNNVIGFLYYISDDICSKIAFLKAVNYYDKFECFNPCLILNGADCKEKLSSTESLQKQLEYYGGSRKKNTKIKFSRNSKMKAGNPENQHPPTPTPPTPAPSPPTPSPKPLEIYKVGTETRKVFSEELNNVFGSFDANDLNKLTSDLAASQLGSVYTFTTKEKQFSGSNTLFFVIEIKIQKGKVISHLSVHTNFLNWTINVNPTKDELGMVHCVNDDWKKQGKKKLEHCVLVS